jgi:hypothetical protein
MIDTGCNSHLLPLKKDQLREIARLYPKNESIWELSYCDGNCTLIVKKLVRIMNANIPLFDDGATQHVSNFELPYLRLCREDVRLLMDMFDEGRIVVSFYNVSEHQLRKDLHIIAEKRREHARVGQNFILAKGIQQSC